MLKKTLSIFSLLSILLVSDAPLFAQDTGTHQGTEIKKDTSGDNEFSMKKFMGLACGIGIALAAMGGAIGQALVGSSALSGLARNPGASDKLFLPFILGLVFIESLVIYTLVISFIMVFKL